ncbi:hypothetical protein [Sphingosinicella humi]|uniref:Uncharacterized protein n=1 Tax=Allosphingosinicella humi TaxID=2068657 RepID=A0A2U2J593_9SPHN|nr:hypothetical protein [Sphingosinicella humi]PWG03508.1 hypothetical protein DF286_11975 [Sphingosinicella humi]
MNTRTAQTFVVASDDRLARLIEGARDRLVFLAPAVTEPVAKALAARLPEVGRLDITIILDADPEVYRLGYGSPSALELLRTAAAKHLFPLQIQPGIRIGLLIADTATLLYSPVPQLIEAGSTSDEKPNAVMISGSASEKLAVAAGAGPAEKTGDQEVGLAALTPEAATAITSDLKANPPQKFDIVRSVRVFSSQLQYIELKVQNCRFSSRRVALPPELLNVADKNLKDRISSGIRPPADALGPFTIDILDEDGSMKKRKVSEKWLSQERERIEQSYTFEVPKYGRVILRSERAKFDAEVERFETNLRTYRAAVNASLEKVKSKFANTMVTEFLPRWKQRSPDYMKRFNDKPPVEDLKAELHRIANELLDKAFVFEEPSIRVVPKDIAPESAAQEEFLVKLRVAMEKKRIPASIIASLFRNFDAAEGAKQEGLLL